MTNYFIIHQTYASIYDYLGLKSVFLVIVHDELFEFENQTCVILLEQYIDFNRFLLLVSIFFSTTFDHTS